MGSAVSYPAASPSPKAFLAHLHANIRNRNRKNPQKEGQQPFRSGSRPAFHKQKSRKAAWNPHTYTHSVQGGVRSEGTANTISFLASDALEVLPISFQPRDPRPHLVGKLGSRPLAAGAMLFSLIFLALLPLIILASRLPVLREVSDRCMSHRAPRVLTGAGLVSFSVTWQKAVIIMVTPKGREGKGLGTSDVHSRRRKRKES